MGVDEQLLTCAMLEAEQGAEGTIALLKFWWARESQSRALCRVSLWTRDRYLLEGFMLYSQVEPECWMRSAHFVRQKQGFAYLSF